MFRVFSLIRPSEAVGQKWEAVIESSNNKEGRRKVSLFEWEIERGVVGFDAILHRKRVVSTIWISKEEFDTDLPEPMAPLVYLSDIRQRDRLHRITIDLIEGLKVNHLIGDQQTAGNGRKRFYSWSCLISRGSISNRFSRNLPERWDTHLWCWESLFRWYWPTSCGWTVSSLPFLQEPDQLGLPSPVQADTVYEEDSADGGGSFWLAQTWDGIDEDWASALVFKKEGLRIVVWRERDSKD